MRSAPAPPPFRSSPFLLFAPGFSARLPSTNTSPRTRSFRRAQLALLLWSPPASSSGEGQAWAKRAGISLAVYFLMLHFCKTTRASTRRAKSHGLACVSASGNGVGPRANNAWYIYCASVCYRKMHERQTFAPSPFNGLTEISLSVKIEGGGALVFFRSSAAASSCFLFSNSFSVDSILSTAVRTNINILGDIFFSCANSRRARDSFTVCNGDDSDCGCTWIDD
jgi:hypothetical protein